MVSSRASRLVFGVALIAMGFGAASARADTTNTATWTGNGSRFDWSDTGNWANNQNPDGGGNAVVHFAGTNSLTPYNNYGLNTQFQQIQFDAFAGAFTLNGNDVKLYGGPAKIENYSSLPQTVNMVLTTESSLELNPVNGDITLNRSLYADANGASVDVYGNNGRTLTINGTITNGNASRSLAVHQNSTVVLTAANSYSAGTTLFAGTLRANNTAGSATGTGAVTVAAAATLGGTGTISGPVDVLGTVTAGADATQTGTLTTGTQTWESTGTYDAKLAAGGASDKLVMSGLSFTTSGFTLRLDGLTGATYANGQQWTLATVTGRSAPFTAAVIASLQATLSTAGSAPSADHFSLSSGDGGVSLMAAYSDTAAPEPTSLLLAGVAVVPLLRRARRANPA